MFKMAISYWINGEMDDNDSDNDNDDINQYSNTNNYCCSCAMRNILIESKEHIGLSSELITV